MLSEEDGKERAASSQVTIRDRGNGKAGVYLGRTDDGLAISHGYGWFTLDPDEWQALKEEGDRLMISRDCRCGISGRVGTVAPFACPVHGVPCDVCGGVESCTEDCGTAPGDPAGTVTDLRTGGPRTVTRDGDCLVIPALRLDAKGCALLRQVINNEIADLAGGQMTP